MADAWLFTQTVISGVISGAIVAWLFASPERRQDAINQVRKLRSFGFKVMVLTLLGMAMAWCAYAFVRFANATGPITRSEVIELFVHFMNFFVFLTAAIIFAAIWRASVLKQMADKAKPDHS